MKQINLSNKQLNIDEISKFDKDNISSKCGKPLCGLWFSPAIENAKYHQISEWHSHIEFNFGKNRVNREYLTDNNTTYVTELSLKENTKTLTVSELNCLFSENATKKEIINKLKLQNIDNLVLKIDSKKDLDLINMNYRGWDNISTNNYSKIWQYIAKNFIGCEFSENLFKTVNRLDSNLISILDVPSLVIFDNKGFNFKTTEQKLIFNTFDAQNRLDNELNF